MSGLSQDLLDRQMEPDFKHGVFLTAMQIFLAHEAVAETIRAQEDGTGVVEDDLVVAEYRLRRAVERVS